MKVTSRKWKTTNSTPKSQWHFILLVMVILAGLDAPYYDLSVLRKDRNHFLQLSQIKIHFRSAE